MVCGCQFPLIALSKNVIAAEVRVVDACAHGLPIASDAASARAESSERARCQHLMLMPEINRQPAAIESGEAVLVDEQLPKIVPSFEPTCSKHIRSQLSCLRSGRAALHSSANSWRRSSRRKGADPSAILRFKFH